MFEIHHCLFVEEGAKRTHKAIILVEAEESRDGRPATSSAQGTQV